MWLSVISVPAGGYLADRFKRPLVLATAASLVVAGLLAWLTRSDAVITILVLIGLIGGHPAGPIMSLTARVLAPETGRSGGRVLHSLLCRDDAAAGGGGPAGQIGRHGRGRARPRRADGAGLPAPDVAFRTHCVCSSSPRRS